MVAGACMAPFLFLIHCCPYLPVLVSLSSPWSRRGLYRPPISHWLVPERRGEKGPSRGLSTKPGTAKRLVKPHLSRNPSKPKNWQPRSVKPSTHRKLPEPRELPRALLTNCITICTCRPADRSICLPRNYGLDQFTECFHQLRRTPTPPGCQPPYRARRTNLPRRPEWGGKIHPDAPAHGRRNTGRRRTRA